MSTHDHDQGPSRRKVLECMTWAGTGVLWTVAGGVPHSLGLIDQAMAQQRQGLHLPADQRQPYGLRQAGQSQRQGHAGRGDRAASRHCRPKPSFMIHTGDITHLSKESEFDDAEKIISAGASSTCTTCRASTTSSTRRSSSTRNATAAAPKARVITASTPMACTSSGLSTSPISRAAAWAVSATSSSNGSRTI